MRMTEIEEWLGQVDPQNRERVEHLAALIHAADNDIDDAIKWRRLTFTKGGDWHHWLCAVAVTTRGVNLMFHKGALLDDPANLLRGEGKYLRQVPHDKAVANPAEITTLIRQAAERQTDMLD